MNAQPTRVIWLPLNAYEAFRELQGRILAYEVDLESAKAQLQEILAPYVTSMPGPDDATVIALKDSPTYSFGVN